MLPVELTNEDIRNSAAYKEYYAIASGAAPPKTKASVRKTQSSSDTTITPPMAAGIRLLTSAKGKQPAKSSKAKGLSVLSEVAMTEDDGTGILLGVPDVPTDEEISWKSSDEDDDDDVDDCTKEEEIFDPIVQTPKSSDDEGNDDAILGMNVGGKEGQDAEDDDEELYRDMNKAVKVADQLQSDRLQDEAQAENEDFVNKLDENIQKIIKEQVKEQVKTQVSKILPKIEKIMNEQLEAEVLTRSSNSSNTSYTMAVDLSKMELKKILIKKMESNKSIHRLNEQRNLYKALVDAYECDKIILDTYGDTVMLKRRHDDANKDEEPFAGSDLGSKRRREGKVPESTSALKERATKTTSNASSHKYTTSVTKTKAADYGHNKWIEDLVPHTMWSQEPFSYDKYALWGISHWGRKRQQFYGFAVNRESARDVYSKRRIIAIIELKIIEWHNYKHLDWITVRRDDDKFYKFKEGDFKRLRIQDIKDMLLLLVQGKLINLTVEERFAFNVSLRMFTRSIVIQRRMEDLQLGVKIYQKKLNLTKPDTYRSNVKRKEAYTAYSNPRGFIYPNKDKLNSSSVSIPISEESDNSLSDNFSLRFETFYDHTKETRSDTTTHANDSLPEYDSFCFEIESDQERLINVVKNDISDDSSNDPLLEEADLFLASDNSIPLGIENFADDSEGDIHFLKELLIDDSIPFPVNELPESDFDNPSFPRPPPEPPDAETDAREKIPVLMNDNDELECLNPRDEFDDDDYSYFMFVIYPEMFSFLLSAKNEDTIFDPGISI
nr:hypothetical protein [Tanacetum cinerariifolium]